MVIYRQSVISVGFVYIATCESIYEAYVTSSIRYGRT